MGLEERVALWVDMGVLGYQEASDLQLRLVDARRSRSIPDVILSLQHPAEVSFSSDDERNQFSPEFVSELTAAYGRVPQEDMIAEHLLSRGVRFSRVKRGGGSTVVAPGQLVYYPIVDIVPITSHSLDAGGYKGVIEQVMLHALRAVGVEQAKIKRDERYDPEFTHDRRDVWLELPDRDYKLGSKGVYLSGGIASHGFALYVDRAGLEHFRIVRPCGHDPKKVGVISVEEATGRSVPHADVHAAVRSQMKERFRYDRIVDISTDELYVLLRS